MPQAVVIEAVRTPFGRKGGVFREIRPDTLLAGALAGLCERAGVSPAKIEDVVTGCVSQAGEQGANIGRLAALLAGFPVEVPAVTLNRMCGSSQQAVHFASQQIAAGDAFYTIGCGIENMTRVPMFSDVGTIDKLNPELAKFNLIHQGESAERLAEKYKITRRTSTNSPRRATAARASRPPSSATRRFCPPSGSTAKASRLPSRATRAFATRSIRPRWHRCRPCFARTVTAWSPPPIRARSPMAPPPC